MNHEGELSMVIAVPPFTDDPISRPDQAPGALVGIR